MFECGCTVKFPPAFIPSCETCRPKNFSEGRWGTIPLSSLNLFPLYGCSVQSVGASLSRAIHR
jgi:hypothetical protein